MTSTAATAAAPPAVPTAPGVPDDPSIVPADAVAAACLSDLVHGLSAAEAARRLARDGTNTLRALPVASPWRRALASCAIPSSTCCCWPRRWR